MECPYVFINQEEHRSPQVHEPMCMDTKELLAWYLSSPRATRNNLGRVSELYWLDMDQQIQAVKRVIRA